MKKTCVVALAIFLMAGCSSEKENKQEAESFPVINPILIDTSYTQEYVADIQSIQNVEIRARIKGYMEAIHVDEGKTVRAGQLLFTISSKEYREALAKAKATLKSAIAEAKAAEVEFENASNLVEKKVVSKSEKESAQARLDAANARVEEARSDESAAALNLSFAEIRAPFDGIISRIPNKVGSLVEEGTLLTVISDNREVFAYFNVSEREYLDIVGSKEKDRKEASLILANGDLHKQPGVVETVDGLFDKSTGNISFRARFPNPEGILKHGSSGKVRLNTELKNALLIPQKSTFEIQEKTFVYVLDKNNTVHMRSIVTGLRMPHFYVIGSGLEPSDKLIYEGIQKVKEGDKIIPEIIQPSQIKNL